jgi:hypothetical protein
MIVFVSVSLLVVNVAKGLITADVVSRLLS